MARIHFNRLTARFVANAPTGKYTDGQGLMLWVQPSGTRQWVQRLFIQGRRRDMGLGGYPLVSLANARKKAIENRLIAREGGDPRVKVLERIPTFEEATKEVHSIHAPSLKTIRDKAQWIEEVARVTYGEIGHLPVNLVTTGHLLNVFKPVWTKNPVLAKRVRGRARKIFDWTIALHHRSDNPAGDSLSALLTKQPNGKHHPSIPYSEVHKALQAVRTCTSSDTAKVAFEFLVLTATRKRETLSADWSEMDLDARVWTIPASRMKAGRVHRVPLSDGAMAILEGIKVRSGLVFPSPRGKALDPNTLNKLLEKERIPASPHGFRTTFKSWCRDNGIPEELSEACLAHVEADKTVAAYSHGTDMLERRREVMQGWSEYVTTAP